MEKKRRNIFPPRLNTAPLKARSYKLLSPLKFQRIIRFPKMMLWAMFMEGVETKQMIHTFVREGRGKLILSTADKRPTAEEMHRAKAQLKDIPKFLPFFVIIVAPVPGVTESYVFLAITLEKWLGHKISLLPSHFRELFNAPKEEDV
jgi:hypothetical protein